MTISLYLVPIIRWQTDVCHSSWWKKPKMHVSRDLHRNYHIVYTHSLNLFHSRQMRDVCVMSLRLKLLNKYLCVTILIGKWMKILHIHGKPWHIQCTNFLANQWQMCVSWVNDEKNDNVRVCHDFDRQCINLTHSQKPMTHSLYKLAS